MAGAFPAKTPPATTSSPSPGTVTPLVPSNPRPGPWPILEMLQEQGIPATRANYLAISHPGKDPDEQLHPEAELDLPPGLRLGWEVEDGS